MEDVENFEQRRKANAWINQNTTEKKSKEATTYQY